MSEGLSGCPFCGGNVEGRWRDVGDCWVEEYYVIGCYNKSCHAYEVEVSVKAEYNYKKDKRDKIELARKTAMDNAILLWNTRVIEDALRAENKRLKTELDEAIAYIGEHSVDITNAEDDRSDGSKYYSKDWDFFRKARKRNE